MHGEPPNSATPNLPAVLGTVPTVPVALPRELGGAAIALPVCLEEPEPLGVVRRATEDAPEADEVRLERLRANPTTLTDADIEAVQARISWLQDMLDGPTIQLDHLKAWLWPKNLACVRPETPVDFNARCTVLAFMLADLPAALFTTESVRQVRSRFFPSIRPLDASVLCGPWSSYAPSDPTAPEARMNPGSALIHTSRLHPGTYGG